MQNEPNASNLGIYLNGVLLGTMQEQQIELPEVVSPGWVDPAQPVEGVLKGIKLTFPKGEKLPRKAKKRAKKQIMQRLEGFPYLGS